MTLEDYFEFLADNDIRIKGHRIGIESILYEYIHRSQTPEEIAHRFSTLRLDQVYATILYYLCNKRKVNAYMTEWLAHEDRMYAEQVQNPPPEVLRLRHIKKERQAAEQKARERQSA